MLFCSWKGKCRFGGGGGGGRLAPLGGQNIQYFLVPTKQESEVGPQESFDFAGYETVAPQNVSAHELTL